MRIPCIFLLLTLWGSTALPQAVANEDQRLLDVIAKLSEEDPESRAAAIGELVRAGDPRLETFFEIYRTGGIYLWNGQPVIGGEIRTTDDLDEFVPLLHVLSREPVLDEAGRPIEVPIEEVEELDVGRAERKLARAAKFRVGLASPDPVRRLAAVKRLGDPPRQPEAVEEIAILSESDPVKKIRYIAKESVHLIRMTDDRLSSEQRLVAARGLGELRSARAYAVIQEMLDNEAIAENEVENYAGVVAQIEGYRKQVRLFDNIKRGVSTGSILILMALGLAITFGLMGVINMAHGEMMMIGAYTTFCMQLLFGHSSGEANNIFFLFALPASFLVAAGVGGIIELLVVRHLYRRPLESLLATFGVSLVLIQTVRLLFGDNQASNSPTWLVGGFEILQDMPLPYARVFILGLTVACVTAMWALMRFTRLGLNMRATMQNRSMAESMGVNTRAVDLFTFMLGSGLAGVAGCGLTTIGGITPDMGQNYIIDSFLVVVTGGVGALAGVICSGFGLGMVNQLLEGTLFGPVWAKIVILILLIAFIQFKPAGLFPPKGRLADA